MSRFDIQGTPIDGLTVLKRRPIEDSRGLLERLFCQETLNELLDGESIKQINRTVTRHKGSVRGLHFQNPPYAETKIVSCLRGEVWDVAVDLRKGSRTFLKHHAIVLTEHSQTTFVIPKGFAHGFQTLAPNCELLYFHTADYRPNAEGGINALDPRLAIEWPETIAERSERDTKHPMLQGGFSGIDVL